MVTNKDYYLLLIGVSIPFAGRFFSKVIFKEVLKAIFGGIPCTECIKPSSGLNKYLLETKDVVTGEAVQKKLLIVAADSDEVRAAKERINANDSFPEDQHNMFSTMSWLEVRIALGWSQQMAVSVAMLRLFFWHWLQPIMYFWTLYTFSSQISELQLDLALCVAARELLYIAITLWALNVSPTFLLFNVAIGWKSKSIPLAERITILILFVVCPEKFVLFYADSKSSNINDMKYIPILITIICDLLGMAALVVGSVRNELPVPLAVGYCVTLMGTIAFVGMALFECCRYAGHCGGLWFR
jgi:hypothetical protein